jgi:hypothetical protein
MLKVAPLGDRDLKIGPARGLKKKGAPKGALNR